MVHKDLSYDHIIVIYYDQVNWTLFLETFYDLVTFKYTCSAVGIIIFIPIWLSTDVKYDIVFNQVAFMLRIYYEYNLI